MPPVTLFAEPELARKTARNFRNAGLVFAALGAFAVLVPTVATVVVEQLIAWLLVLWGLAGLMFARSFRGFSEWRIVAGAFFVVLLAGLWFVFFPGGGASFMTIMLAVVFLLEGILSILLGLRMSGQLANWGWIVFSGASAFVLGLIILFSWPETARWVVGFLVGLNFLTTGMSLLFVSRAVKVNFKR